VSFSGADFPDTAPLIPAKGVPETFKPVMLESYLFPTVIENIGTVIGIDVGFVENSIVAAKWNRAVFPASSAWALATMSINLDNKTHKAFMLQPLQAALEWGAIGLRRPPAGRQGVTVSADGTIALTEAGEQDFAAYYEVCNVIGCGVLARAWRTKLDRPLVILLDDVAPVTASQFPQDLSAKSLIVVQGTAGYSERKLPSTRDGKPQYEHHAPLQLILPQALAVNVLWGAADGTEKKKTDWLVKTGTWRWSK
jgi:hypothetical protein